MTGSWVCVRITHCSCAVCTKDNTYKTLKGKTNSKSKIIIKKKKVSNCAKGKPWYKVTEGIHEHTGKDSRKQRRKTNAGSLTVKHLVPAKSFCLLCPIWVTVKSLEKSMVWTGTSAIAASGPEHQSPLSWCDLDPGESSSLPLWTAHCTVNNGVDDLWFWVC